MARCSKLQLGSPSHQLEEYLTLLCQSTLDLLILGVLMVLFWFGFFFFPFRYAGTVPANANFRGAAALALVLPTPRTSKQTTTAFSDNAPSVYLLIHTSSSPPLWVTGVPIATSAPPCRRPCAAAPCPPPPPALGPSLPGTPPHSLPLPPSGGSAGSLPEAQRGFRGSCSSPAALPPSGGCSLPALRCPGPQAGCSPLLSARIPALARRLLSLLLLFNLVVALSATRR